MIERRPPQLQIADVIRFRSSEGPDLCGTDERNVEHL